MDIRSKYQEVILQSGETIRNALQKLCKSEKRILFLLDGTKLLGTLNDGDIRRFLLKGGSLDAPVERVANFHALYLLDTERERARVFLEEHRIHAVPIVDDDKNVIDISFLYDTVEVDKAEIRCLTYDDINMVLEFFDQMAGDTRAMFNRGDINRIRVIEHLGRKHEDYEVHFGAVVTDENGNEKMVGYVFMWELNTLIPWLGICVREDWKGHHLGRKLLEFLDAYAGSRGYGGLMLTSVPANVRAHSLYERMGFVYFGTYPSSEFLYIKRYSVSERGKYASI